MACWKCQCGGRLVAPRGLFFFMKRSLAGHVSEFWPTEPQWPSREACKKASLDGEGVASYSLLLLAG